MKAATIFAQGDPSIWADFGLPGLVILALFTALGVGIKLLFVHLGSVNTQHRQDLQHQNELHRDERTAWKADDTEIHARTVESIQVQTAAIKAVETQLQFMSQPPHRRIEGG